MPSTDPEGACRLRAPTLPGRAALRGAPARVVLWALFLLLEVGWAAGAPGDSEKGFPLRVVDRSFPEDLASGISEEGSGWLPFYVELQPGGERPVTAELIGTVERQDGRRWVRAFTAHRRIEAAPGASTRAWLYLRYEGGTLESLRVRLKVVAEGQTLELEGGQIHLTPGADEYAIPMVVTGEHTRGAVSPWGDGGLAMDPGQSEGRGKISSRRIVRMEEKTLPDRWQGYQGVKLLLLRNFDEKVMEPEQIEAIRRWVFTGGWVILVPSPRGEIFRTRLVRDLLPGARIEEPRAAPGFLPRELWAATPASSTQRAPAFRGRESGWRRFATFDGSSLNLGAGKSYTVVDPVKATARREIYSTGSDGWVGERLPAAPLTVESPPPGAVRLYHETAFGEGRVGLLTFDDLSFGEESLGFRGKLWAQIVGETAGSSRNMESRREPATRRSGLLEKLRSGLTREVGVWFIALLVLTYLLLIGPGLYFLLKRMGRLPALVWVEPLVVLLSLGFVAGTAYLEKGILTRVETVKVIHHFPDQPYLRVNGFFALFSADQAAYRITAPGSDLIYPLEGSEKASLEVEEGDPSRGAALLHYPLAKWATGLFGSFGLKEPPAGFGAPFELKMGPPETGKPLELEEATIRNRSGLPMRQGWLFVEGQRAYLTGPIPAGGEARLRAPFSGIELEAAPGAGQDPFRGDDLLREAVRAALETGPVMGGGAPGPVFVGLLEDAERHFVLDGPSTEKRRLVLLAEHRPSP